MRVIYTFIPAALAVMMAFSGCVKEKCSRKFKTKIFTPVYTATADYYASVKAEEPRAIEQAGKIYAKGTLLFVNEIYKGIHVIDNSDPKAPEAVSFINVPGNIDIAAKGNYLYADSYSDLLVFDISDPRQIKLEKRVGSVLNFPYNADGLTLGYQIPQSPFMITGYTSRDTVYDLDCTTPERMIFFDAAVASFASSLKSNNSGGSGKGGSMARFTIAKDYLYTVNHSQLKSFDLANAASPLHKSDQQVGGNIETIFPYGEYLFIGSRNAMYIYDIINPASPARRSQVTHFRACDPVVVEGTTAYVTLRTGTICAGNLNELQVFDVKDVDNPVKLATYQMKGPYGLGVDNGKLFVCEGPFGLRFMNAPEPLKITTAKLVEGLDAYDVIPYYDQHLLVSARGGIYQYDYTNINNPVLLSKISTAAK
ncbi:LVIVD repeat-containing protein [Chitinophaga cymbidii]|uniref:LVIVD repeat-containing protein n=1 Tax=Chitinophaga cymbidii TaxID=1096750 RepID=A0A512RI13_9BACT|nr:hypothetical protein [Chitinophaga cymbidii]GEP95346.1 hypothetical protein CCY01nite_16060 [Chitinophaga cymbidii]